MDFIYFAKIGDGASIAINRNKVLSVRPHAEGGTMLYMQESGMHSSYHVQDNYMEVVARLNNGG